MTAIFPTYKLGDLVLTSYPYAVEFGGDHGAPETITELTQSLLGDGDLVRVARNGNREISIVVHVEGPTLGALTNFEAALRLECAKPRNFLVFEPGDIDSVASVFEVFAVEMRQPRDDEVERHMLRRWELTLTCQPFARSLNPVMIDQLASGSTTTSVDTCDSATGWTATRNGVPGTASTGWEAGSVGIAELDNAVTAPEAWGLTRTGSVDFTSTPYLVVEVRTIASDYGPPLDFRATISGVQLPVLAVTLIPGTVYYRVVFNATGFGVVSAISFEHVSRPGHPWQGVFIRQVSRSNVLPGSNARQVSRIVDVGGTERTVASLRVKSPTTTDLRHTLVATWPEKSAGFFPSMRRYRATGNTVAPDAATISGSREAIGPSAVSFGVPASSIPAGAYQLVARLRSVGATGSLNVFWEAGTSVEGVLLDGTISGSYDASFPVVGRWEMVPLGTLVLPVIAANAGDLFMGINHAGSTQVEYDEVWLLPIGEDCAISGADVTATRYWCDAPDHTESNPSFRIGNTDDRSNARSPGMATIAKGVHTMRPGPMVVFVATTVDGPLVDGSLYERWHSNAAS